MRTTILVMAAAAIGATAFAVAANADEMTNKPVATAAAASSNALVESWAKAPTTPCPAGWWWQGPHKDEWSVWRPGRCVASL